MFTLYYKYFIHIISQLLYKYNHKKKLYQIIYIEFCYMKWVMKSYIFILI